jgi:hypothetical protein
MDITASMELLCLSLLVFMAVWNATDFNTFSVDVVISTSVATGKNIRIHFGRGVDAKLAILVDDVQIVAKSTASPTPSPTFAPVYQVIQPTNQPTLQVLSTLLDL